MALSSQTASCFTKRVGVCLKNIFGGVGDLFFEVRLKASNVYSFTDIASVDSDGAVCVYLGDCIRTLLLIVQFSVNPIGLYVHFILFGVVIVDSP
jgi:hypothetical protein